MTTAMPTILPHDQVDEDLAAHFAALGVGTISAYKLWCHRHGLSKGLDKTEVERAEERAFFASLQAPVDPEAQERSAPQTHRLPRSRLWRTLRSTGGSRRIRQPVGESRLRQYPRRSYETQF